jgi:hypothetical protein
MAPPAHRQRARIVRTAAVASAPFISQRKRYEQEAEFWPHGLEFWPCVATRRKKASHHGRMVAPRLPRRRSLLPSSRGAGVRRVLEEFFTEYGTPRAIQCDNGSPFISTRARGGLTELSAWLVSLGVKLIRSRPGKPQDNGGHERMHRDMSELELAPARSRRAQQHECDRWLIDFNNVRPHDALGGKTPAEVYKPCRRAPLLRLPTYPPEYKVRRVNHQGVIKVNGDCVYLNQSLRHQLVGLQHESGLRWHAWFHDVDLGTIEIANLNDALSTLSAAESIAVNPSEDMSNAVSVSA